MCDGRGGLVCAHAAIHRNAWSVSSSPMSHRPRTLQQIPRARRLPTKWPLPHYRHGGGARPVWCSCTSHHRLHLHRSTSPACLPAGRASIQHARWRISTNASFLISFHNRWFVIHLKTPSLTLRVSVYLPTFRSFWYFSTWGSFFFIVSG